LIKLVRAGASAEDLPEIIVDRRVVIYDENPVVGFPRLFGVWVFGSFHGFVRMRMREGRRAVPE
jgi:hypothetical protein